MVKQIPTAVFPGKNADPQSTPPLVDPQRRITSDWRRWTEFVDVTVRRLAGFFTFLKLEDTPDSYSGQTLKVVRVKADESGLEFATLAAFTDEAAQDAVGAMVDTTLVYVDATPLLTRAALTGDVTAAQGSNATTIANSAVTLAKIANASANSKLLGSGAAGSGAPYAELTLGTGLSMSGTTLNASTGTGDVVGPASAVNNRVVFFDGTTGKLIKDSGLTLSGANTGDQTLPVGGNPTATAGDVAINGVSTDFMRKDGAPPVQKGSSSQFGILKVDGTTITEAGGVASASGLVASATLSPAYTSTTPGAPATGSLLFSRKRANYTLAAQIGISNVDAELQNFLGSAEVSMIVGLPGTIVPGAFGCLSLGNFATSRTQTTTSQYTAYRRGGVSNVSGANGFGQMRTNIASYFRGNSSVIGGVFMSVRFGVETTIANSRLAAGMFAAWAGNNDVSNATDAFFFGKDSADTNLQVMHNDNAGTCTKVDLGASFPANTSATDMYEGRLWIPPNGSTMYYWIKNLVSGAEADGSVNTNLPTTTTAMFAGAWFGTGSTSGVHAGALCQFYTATGMP